MTAARGLDRLHPGLVHHIVNSLGWSTLRPLQAAAIDPLLDGDDALLLAPTAAGKTEAASFPILTAMAERGWRDLSVLYICPLRALLNNLHPRIAAYAAWLGRVAGLWHGDTGAGPRRRMRLERPDILLTTPESVESLLVSTLIDQRAFFGGLRAVIVDEVHAFAGDDRGWHLLAVLERLTRLCGRPLQRIGLSATVGNPDELLHWLQGGNAGECRGTVVAPDRVGGAVAPALPPVEVGLDYVGSIGNAATVISLLHQGEKRLAFAESRGQVEELALALRSKGVTTFVSHSSLSVDERRRAEEAFAEARDCVIVATSTLELGVDVGDLDRVIQLDAPRTVASFLQRLGRTGRRPGSDRNTLFLATRQTGLLQAAGLLRLWRAGYVEPIVPPPTPHHIGAQQLLALCLQEGRVGETTWPQWLGTLPLFGPAPTAPAALADWLAEGGFLERDQGMLFIGPETERRYGRRHFMELLAVFTAAPEFTVLHGRNVVGSTDALMLMTKVEGPRLIALGGRAWRVTHVDWSRRRCHVDVADTHARSAWHGVLPPQSYELSQAQRDVLLGADPDVAMSRRAQQVLVDLRTERAAHVWSDGVAVEHRDGDSWWWTWAGRRANAVLARALPDVVDPDRRVDDHAVRLRSDVTPESLRLAIGRATTEPLPAPEVSPEAVSGLKFGEVLPPEAALSTVAARLTDSVGAAAVLVQPVGWIR